MSLTSLAKLFGLFSLLVQLSVALPQASTCSCNGNISQKGSGECKTTHEGHQFCYVNQGQCPDQQESSQSGWFWSYRACGQGTRSTPQEPDLRSRASTCSCNGNISPKGSGECKTNHENHPFCYVNQGQCPDEQESSQSGWFWSKQACASASSCSCNGNLNGRGGGECQGDDDGQPYCYVNQGQCTDQQESSKSGWFWSEQACAQGTKSTLQKPDLFSGGVNVGPQSFAQFQQIFEIQYATQAETTFRQEIFDESLSIVNGHNNLYDNGQSSYFLKINQFSDRTFEEYGNDFTGLGLLNLNEDAEAPPATFRRSFETRNRRQSYSAQDTVDWKLAGGVTPVRKQDPCNSCAAHAAISVMESCLWKATGILPPPVSVQQMVDCNNDKIGGEGTPLARKNFGCKEGWPDVHFNYTIEDLGGKINKETDYPLESNRKNTSKCLQDERNNLEFGAKVTDFDFEFFSDEEALKEYVGLFGPSVTNMDASRHTQFYGGGVFYNETQCDNIVDEPVPEACREDKDGREGYTCLPKGDVKCGDLLPQHCSRYFKRPTVTKQGTRTFTHSLTVVGYGVDENNWPFWKLKNSWGRTWGDNGYMKIYRGSGHCGLGAYIAKATCQSK